MASATTSSLLSLLSAFTTGTLATLIAPHTTGTLLFLLLLPLNCLSERLTGLCGTIKGYKAHLGGSDDGHLFDNDSKTLSNGSETVEKAAEMAEAVSSKSFSGVGSGSNRSTRSEEDVFSDAVIDFGDLLHFVEISVPADQRARLIMSTEKQNQTSVRIKDSRRTMLETEELGVSILQDLHGQRHALLLAH